MNSLYTGFYTALQGDEVCVDGNGFTIFADLNEKGEVEHFALLQDNNVVLSLNTVEHKAFMTAIALLSGEQMRRTVKSMKETK